VFVNTINQILFPVLVEEKKIILIQEMDKSLMDVTKKRMFCPALTVLKIFENNRD
jgi:hypothetical protein